MSFNGAGVFVINSVGNPTVTGTTISSTWANDLTADLATGLSNTVCKDGQQTTTARVPFAAGISLTATNLDSVATQAQQETGTSTVTAVVSGRQHYHPSAAKAYVRFTDTGAIVGTSFGVTSVADTGTAIWTVTYSTAFAATTFNVVSGAEYSSSDTAATTFVLQQVNLSTTTTRIFSHRVSDGALTEAAGNSSLMNVTAFGDQ